MTDAEPMDVEEQAPFSTIHILKLVQDAQQMHGLRHGNYKRYGDYCGRRTQRLRKALSYKHNHKCVPKRSAKFVYKSINAEDVTDPKFLELLVYNVEKCWARGMEFKVGSEDEVHTRQKFHARTRLLKALKYARSLESITDASSRVNSLTKLETKAYNAYIAGTYFIEKQNWSKALESYKLAKSIYDKLHNLDESSDLAPYYAGRCRELAKRIELCEYSRGGDASQVATEMMHLDLSETGGEINSAISNIVEQRAAEAKVKKESKETAPARVKPAPKPKKPLVIPKPPYYDIALKYIAIPEDIRTIATSSTRPVQEQPAQQQQQAQASGLTGALKSFIWGR